MQKMQSKDEGEIMPAKYYNEVKKRGGAKGYRIIHPKGRKDVNILIAIVKKKGKKGGTTVAGEITKTKVR